MANVSQHNTDKDFEETGELSNKFEGIVEPLIESKKERFSLEVALKTAGDLGLYQSINTFILCLIWFIIPTIPVMLPFFRIPPNFTCFKTENGVEIGYKCSQTEMCNVDIKKNRVLDDGLKTIATDYNLFCENSIYFGFIALFYFIGILFGNFFISKFSDSYGRKAVLVFFMVVYLFVVVLTIFSWTYYVFFFSITLVGVLYSGTSLCAFVLNFESTTKENKTKISTFLNMSYGIGAIINITAFYFFQNWIISMMFSGVLTLILFLFLVRVKESPSFLYVSKQYTELFNVLDYIARVNSNKDQLDQYLKSTDMKRFQSTKMIQEVKVYGVLDVLTFKSIWFHLLVLCLNWFVMTMVYYGINFNILKFGADPYLIGIVVYISEILSQYISISIIETIGHKKTIISAYLLCSVSLICLDIFHENDYLKYLFLFFAKFEISTVNSVNYIYTSGLFPTKIRVASLSICAISSRFGGIFTTLIIEVISWSMTLFGISCGFSLILLLWMTEIEQIPELGENPEDSP